MCVVPVVLSWTPYSWFQTRDKAELIVNKTIQFPPPPPPPLNLYRKSYVASGANAEFVLVTQRGRMKDSEL